MHVESRSSLCLGNFMRILGRMLSIADLDIRTRKYLPYHSHSCMSAHINNFLMIRTDPESTMEEFKTKFYIRND